MVELTLPTYEMCFGDNKLEIIKKRGLNAKMTDFAILRGGFVPDFYYKSSDKLKDIVGSYWTKTVWKEFNNEIYNALAIDYTGLSYWESPEKRYIGVRIALSYSSIKDYCINKHLCRR